MASIDHINNVRNRINDIINRNETSVSVGGFHQTEPDHVEGDVWTDLNDRTWTIKNGIKQRVTKLDGAKTPWFCPVCNKTMNHRLDTKFWRMTGKCMDCVIKEETEIRRQGRWKEYEQSKIKANYIDYLKDKIQELTDIHDTITSPEHILADDHQILMIEKWNVDIDSIKNDLKKDIRLLKETLEKVENGEFDIPSE